MQDAGKDTLTAARLRSLLLRKLRPLSPAALSILPLLPSASPAPCHTRPPATPSTAPSAPSLRVDTAMLSAASYLLSDLAAKLAAAESDLRRPFPASTAGNGGATVGRSEAGEHTPGRRTCRSNLVCLELEGGAVAVRLRALPHAVNSPCCTAAVGGCAEAPPTPLPELLSLLQPLLPGIRRHLDAAAATLSQPSHPQQEQAGSSTQGPVQDTLQDKAVFGSGKVLLTQVHSAAAAAVYPQAMAAR